MEHMHAGSAYDKTLMPSLRTGYEWIPARNPMPAILPTPTAPFDPRAPAQPLKLQRTEKLHSAVSAFHISSLMLARASPSWPSWLFSNNLKPHCSVPSLRIHELVNKAISDDRDFSWGTRKVLLKILHMIELGLRIGKASGVLRKGDESGLLNDTTIWIYESSVTSALNSRAWVEGIKDASQDPGTKAKVSATLLKMDIFFLQVPSTVQLWLKETAVVDETKERLKILVAIVKEKISPTDQGSVRQGKAKARPRLLGVVPIVKKRRKRLRSRHPIIDAFLNEEDGADAFADLEDFIE